MSQPTENKKSEQILNWSAQSFPVDPALISQSREFNLSNAELKKSHMINSKQTMGCISNNQSQRNMHAVQKAANETIGLDNHQDNSITINRDDALDSKLNQTQMAGEWSASPHLVSGYKAIRVTQTRNSDTPGGEDLQGDTVFKETSTV